MEPTELVVRLSGSTNGNGGAWASLLAAFREQPHSPRAVADAQGVSVQHVYDVIDALDPLGLVENTTEDVGLTPAGSALFEAYTDARQAVGGEAIHHIARSTSRRTVMTRLVDRPHRPSDLADGPDDPSRDMVRRVIRSFEARNWVRQRDDGTVAVTDGGLATWATYDRLETATRQAIQKAPFLNRIGPHHELPPLTTLRHATLVEPTVHDSNPMLDASLELANARSDPVDEIRTIVPVFIPVMFEEFSKLVKLRTSYGIVFYQKLFTPKHIGYLLGSIVAPTVTVRILDESVSYGVGLYDDAMLASVREGAQDPGAGLRTTNERLYEWGESMFEAHWEAGVSLTDVFLDGIRQLAFRQKDDQGDDQSGGFSIREMLDSSDS
jgi:hypothetical protein